MKLCCAYCTVKGGVSKLVSRLKQGSNCNSEIGCRQSAKRAI